jgi:uncharacterized membrane protein YcaP (DUF421 family)
MGTIIRAATAYFLLLLLSRLTPRRAGEAATPFELILLFLVGGATVQAVVADDHSLTNALIGVAAVAWLHVAVAYARRRLPLFGAVVDRTPVVLVEDGRWHADRLAKLRIHEQDVMAAAWRDGLERREQIGRAVFHRNGEIAIVKRVGLGRR